MADLLALARTIIDEIDQCETAEAINDLARRRQPDVDAIEQAPDPLTSVRATHIRNAAQTKRAQLERQDQCKY
jgi:hypothetical protein